MSRIYQVYRYASRDEALALLLLILLLTSGLWVGCGSAWAPKGQEKIYALSTSRVQKFVSLGKTPLSGGILALFQKNGVELAPEAVFGPSKGAPVSQVRRVVWWWLPTGGPNPGNEEFPAYRIPLCDGKIGEARMRLDAIVWVTPRGVIGTFELEMDQKGDYSGIVIESLNAQISSAASTSDRPLFAGVLQFRYQEEIYGVRFAIPLGHITSSQDHQ